jgi:hypothetical protein
MKTLETTIKILSTILMIQCLGACALHLEGTLEPDAEDAGRPDSVADGTVEHIPDGDGGSVDPFGDDYVFPLDADAGEDGAGADPTEETAVDVIVDDGGQEDEVDAACDPALCPGWCCDDLSGGGCCHYASCNELHGAHPELPSGVYEIDTDGDVVGTRLPFEAYCDMAADGGGWTLVGRSTTGVSASVAFGWKSAMGFVHDDSQPYSLNADGAGISFTEILVGSYSSGKLWGDHAYKMQVPSDFLSSYSNSSCTLPGGPVTVIGGCTPSGGPTMLRRAGYTDKTTRFHLRDQAGDYDVGLRAGGFNTYYNDCNRGADLNGLQGMIFVR